MAVLASHGEKPFDEEASGFFAVLAVQANTALANARLFARATELATRDGLTGLYNYRHFFELLEAEISRASATTRNWRSSCWTSMVLAEAWD